MISRPASSTRRHFFLITMRKLSCPSERTLLIISSLPREAPRLCRVGSKSLTFKAVVHRRDSRFVSHHAHEGEFRDGRLREPKPHKMGVQIPRSLHSQVPQKDAVRGAETASRGGGSQTGGTKGKQGRDGPSNARSRPHDDPDPTKIRSRSGDRLYQGQECDPLGSGLR